MRTTAAMALVVAAGLSAHGAGVSLSISTRPANPQNPNTDGYTVDADLDGLGGQRGGNLTPLAIVGLNFNIQITDATSYFGTYLQRSTLTATEAWGQGLPNGYDSPPVTNPTGPWTGMNFGYRDAFDGVVVDGTPGGNDMAAGNGWATVSDPHTALISNIAAVMDWQHYGYHHGAPGNGVNDLAHVFSFDIVDRDYSNARTVHIDVLPSSTASVLVDNNGTLEVLQVAVNALSVDIHVPAPASAAVLTGGLTLIGRRRRR